MIQSRNPRTYRARFLEYQEGKAQPVQHVRTFKALHAYQAAKIAQGIARANGWLLISHGLA